MAEKKQYN